MAKLLTEAELASLINAAVQAERAACAAVCRQLMNESNGLVAYDAALICRLRILARGNAIDGAVSNNDTRPHETPEPNRP